MFNEPPLSDIVRAVLAIGLALALPFLLYFGPKPVGDAMQAYLDVLAAVVAFYFGHSSTQP